MNIIKKKLFILCLCLAGMVMLISGCAPKVTVDTREATAITDSDALINGYISGYDEFPASVGVYLGTTEDNMKRIISDAHPNNLMSAENIDVIYDISVDGEELLSPETTYYYCFYAIVDGKEKAGEVKSFTTVKASDVAKADLTATTGNVEDITSTGATIYGNISNFSEKVTEAGFYVGKSENEMRKVTRDKNPYSNYKDLTEYDIWCSFGNDTTMTLKANTTYYYQVYAKIDEAETKGEIKSFTTPPEPTAAPTETPTDAPAEENTATASPES